MTPESTFIKKRREFVAYGRTLLKKANNPTNKFVIFCQGRTGSTLLYSLLNSHPKIHCDDEILENRVLFPVLYVEGRCAKIKQPVYGFRVKIYQLINNQGKNPEAFLFNLHKNGWKIIYLKRKNILRQAVSRMLANRKNQWHLTSQDKKNKTPSKAYIDCDELIKQIQDGEMYLEKEKEVLDNLNLPYITILYEDDLLKTEKHQETLNRIFDYLGLSSIPVKTQLVRTTSDQLSDFIENYEEVVKAVRQTNYAEFLEF
ncbi:MULTISPECIES: Stf0 family sulfotransferase [unclassified Coleofasciculus]|uniref:Stf0 family sulfotransferase n=1 Tax=unclassified Coleofasciculus TaxID=2692782 RepID=UPI00187F4D13|nr:MULTISPECIES: Stf0 family sulfotransferase [unclassified Coleofasciculus]MBE9126705.1 hypothetical protein [Coleofasciculus sp. LEGE 07081]MBE9150065.1 hypothetical protein [Coleofasciculus sp. LEGE 07092]